MGPKKNWGKRNFGPKRFAPNKFSPPKILGPKFGPAQPQLVFFSLFSFRILKHYILIFLLKYEKDFENLSKF